MSTPCTTPHEPKPRSHEGCPTSPLLTSTTLARQINNEDDNLSIGFRSLVGSPSTDMRAVRLNSPGVRPLSTKASLFRSPPPALTSERVAQHDRDLWAQRQSESPSLLRNIPLFRELSSSSVGFAPFSFIDDMPITTVAVSTEQPALDANDNDSLSNHFNRSRARYHHRDQTPVVGLSTLLPLLQEPSRLKTCWCTALLPKPNGCARRQGHRPFARGSLPCSLHLISDRLTARC